MEFSKCDLVQMHLIDLLEEAGTEGQLAALQEHVAGCASCHSELEDARVIHLAIKNATSIDLSADEEQISQAYLTETWENFHRFLHSQIALLKAEATSAGDKPTLSGVGLLGDAISQLRRIASRTDRLNALKAAVSSAVAELVPQFAGKVDHYWDVLVSGGGGLASIPYAARSSGSAAEAEVSAAEKTVQEMIRLAGRLNGALRKDERELPGLCDDIELSVEAQELLFRQILSPTDHPN